MVVSILFMLTQVSIALQRFCLIRSFNVDALCSSDGWRSAECRTLLKVRPSWNYENSKPTLLESLKSRIPTAKFQPVSYYVEVHERDCHLLPSRTKILLVNVFLFEEPCILELVKDILCSQPIDNTHHIWGRLQETWGVEVRASQLSWVLWPTWGCNRFPFTWGSCWGGCFCPECQICPNSFLRSCPWHVEELLSTSHVGQVAKNTTKMLHPLHIPSTASGLELPSFVPYSRILQLLHACRSGNLYHGIEKKSGTIEKRDHSFQGETCSSLIDGKLAHAAHIWNWIHLLHLHDCRATSCVDGNAAQCYVLSTISLIIM